MTPEDALAIGQRVQQHPYGGKSLSERIAEELLKAYERGVADTQEWRSRVDDAFEAWEKKNAEEDNNYE